jgi:phosphoenolpyruvate carboxylase
MIGYSDSAKDGGRLAANWHLYTAQEAVVAACRDAGVPLTLFHGRGGSIGRGGGPTRLALQSQPPGSVDGRLRVTVQGEMIQAQFGLHDIAFRTLETYTTSVLEATLLRPPPVPQAWREEMERLAATARSVYRQIVYDDARFIEYFQLATPVRELGAVPIGSRPARRGGDRGVESLRAIPWVFAWTQTRLLLPSWLGCGEALDEAIARGRLAQLREMARGWPFVSSTLRLIEVALAEADPPIAAAYDRALVLPALLPVGADLLRRLELARRTVLDVLDTPSLLADNPVLRRSIDVRNPYVDPINIVQIAILSRLRGDGDDHDDAAALWQAFMITVNGIAAGMRSVG